VVQWLAYLGRLFAALVLILLAVIVMFSAITGKESGRPFAIGTAAVFAVAGAFTWPRRPNAWRSDPPTERQLAFARDLGIAVPRGISKGQLSDLISDAKAVRDAF
jgi:hypothetical protein